MSDETKNHELGAERTIVLTEPDEGTWKVHKIVGGSLGGVVGYAWVTSGPKDLRFEYFAFDSGAGAWTNLPFTKDTGFVWFDPGTTFADENEFKTWVQDPNKGNIPNVALRMHIGISYQNWT